MATDRGNLGEAMHTAFRKATDDPNAWRVWKAIDAMDPDAWADVVEFVADGIDHGLPPAALRRAADLLDAHMDGEPHAGHQRGDHEDDGLPALITWLTDQAGQAHTEGDT
jgi:hypothetical protein